jgi:AcrR family transcriptional regulator
MPTTKRADGPRTKDEIVDAALRLVDEGGLGGLTMRALAERLETYPSTIYWHVGNREQLLVLLSDRVVAEVRTDDVAGLEWTEALPSFARRYRAVAHRHPAIARLFATELLVSQPVPDQHELLLQILSRGGFHGAALVAAHNAWLGSLVGWVAVELCAEPRATTPGDTYEASVRALSAVDYPIVTANLDDLLGQAIGFRWKSGTAAPLDAAFEAAVTVWIAGLQALLRGGSP